jgi:Flp pilus assembly protein TadD
LAIKAVVISAGVCLAAALPGCTASQKPVAPEQKPDAPEVIMKTAAQHYTRKDLPEAIRVLRQGTELHPGNAQLHFMLANAWYRQHEWANATVNYRQAAQLRSQHPDTHFCLGFALYEQQLWNDATEAWQVAVRQAPQDSLNHFALALGLFKLGLTNEAKDQAVLGVGLDSNWRTRIALDIRWNPETYSIVDGLAKEVEREAVVE